MRKQIFRKCCAALAGLLIFGAAGPLYAAELGTFERVDNDDEYAAASRSAALVIKIGDVEITVGTGHSAGTYKRVHIETVALDIDPRFLLPADTSEACQSTQAGLAISKGDAFAGYCLDRAELKKAGYAFADADAITPDEVVASGLGTFIKKSETKEIQKQNGIAESRALVVPGFAEESAACTQAKLTNDVSALTTPAPLSPIIVANISRALCSLSLSDLPRALHKSEEVAVDLTLTQTLVNAIPVNDVLDAIQGAGPLPDEVNDAIDEIQANLEAHPVVTISIADNGGDIAGTGLGVKAFSPGTTVKLSVLEGIISLEIGVADATASIDGHTPHAVANANFIRIRVLNIFTPDPDDFLIDEEIDAPGDLELFADGPLAPLHTVIKTDTAEVAETCAGAEALLKSDPDLLGKSVLDPFAKVTSRPLTGGTNAWASCAAARGDGLQVRLLDAPLPTIGIDLVRVEVLSAGSLTVAPTAVIPITGAGAVATVATGLGLAAAALLGRRRIVR